MLKIRHIAKPKTVGRNSMSLSLPYRNFSVCLFDDSQFDPNSVDNPIAYNHVYQSDSRYGLVSRHGIRTLDDEEIVASAIVMATGGATSIHERSALVDDANLIVCCSDTVFCLSLPQLGLSWATQADLATCFGVYQYNDSYIVHGELAITRLDRQGGILWRFSGSDIFTTPNGQDIFQITGDKATVKSWDGSTYFLDLKTGRSSELPL